MNRYFRNCLFLVIFQNFLVSTVHLAAQETVTNASAIRTQVVTPELTRALPKTRVGYILETSRSAGPDRSMSMVEVKVDGDARISLPNIHFKVGSTELADDTSRAQLDELALALKDAPSGQKFLIEGHTCTLGTDETNQRLSAERAHFVTAYLIQQGVAPAALQSLGYGPAEARKDNVTPEDGESRLAVYRKVMIHRIAQ